MNQLKNRGFTLIELLIVVAVIAILATISFVSFNPLQRFQNARDSARQTDVIALMNAVKVYQIDNGGSYLASVSNTNAGEVYMIVNGALMETGCDDNNGFCRTDVTDDNNCVNLNGLVKEGYMAEIPISPSSGNVVWDDGNAAGEEGTGYTISRSLTNSVTIRACESENTTEISITS